MRTARPIAALLAHMEALLAALAVERDPRALLLATYLRTTRAVAADIAAGAFDDPAWTERWDVAFAQLYLDALEQWSASGSAPGPWQEAFAAMTGPRLPTVRHVLLGMNAHVNYDLPQALLAVITDDEFDDPALVARRRADHRHIDAILAARVPAEERALRAVEQPGDRTLLDRILVPFNRRATRRFLREARAKVWSNALVLSRARRAGDLDVCLAALEERARRRVADLRAPGQVILRLARDGFGVELPEGDPAE
jgi:hypothetical protein